LHSEAAVGNPEKEFTIRFEVATVFCWCANENGAEAPFVMRNFDSA